MYFIETILIGISLAMDAFAICLCQGLTTKENKEILALKLGITFGAFQAIMPWLGYSVGNIFSSKVSTYGNILAFIILLLIGINMIKEGKMPEKAVYSLTEAGEQAFEDLMLEIASKPIHIFLDFNSVIVSAKPVPGQSGRLSGQD